MVKILKIVPFTAKSAKITNFKINTDLFYENNFKIVYLRVKSLKVTKSS